jgi:hypothetical protein
MTTLFLIDDFKRGFPPIYDAETNESFILKLSKELFIYESKFIELLKSFS